MLPRPVRIWYLHGRLGSIHGYKGVFLKKTFPFFGVDVDYKPYFSIPELQRLEPCTAYHESFIEPFVRPAEGREIQDPLFQWLDSDILGNEIVLPEDHPVIDVVDGFSPFPFDVIVGSSWGGAILVELMRRGELIPRTIPILLLAPAVACIVEDAQEDQSRVPRYSHLKEYSRVKIVHGKEDEIVPVTVSRQLLELLDSSAQLLELCGEGHALKGILGDEGETQETMNLAQHVIDVFERS